MELQIYNRCKLRLRSFFLIKILHFMNAHVLAPILSMSQKSESFNYISKCAGQKKPGGNGIRSSGQIALMKHRIRL